MLQSAATKSKSGRQAAGPICLRSLSRTRRKLLLLSALRGLLATLCGLLRAALCGLLASCHGASLKVGCASHRRTRDARGDVPGTERGVASAYTRSKFSRNAQYPPRIGTVCRASASIGLCGQNTRFVRLDRRRRRTQPARPQRNAMTRRPLGRSACIARNASQNAGLRVSIDIVVRAHHRSPLAAGATTHQLRVRGRRRAARPRTPRFPEIRVDCGNRQVLPRTDFFLTRGHGNAIPPRRRAMRSRRWYPHRTLFYLLRFRLIFPAALQSSGITCAHS